MENNEARELALGMSSFLQGKEMSLHDLIIALSYILCNAVEGVDKKTGGNKDIDIAKGSLEAFIKVTMGYLESRGYK